MERVSSLVGSVSLCQSTNLVFAVVKLQAGTAVKAWRLLTKTDEPGLKTDPGLQAMCSQPYYILDCMFVLTVSNKKVYKCNKLDFAASCAYIIADIYWMIYSIHIFVRKCPRQVANFPKFMFNFIYVLLSFSFLWKYTGLTTNHAATLQMYRKFRQKQVQFQYASLI